MKNKLVVFILLSAIVLVGLIFVAARMPINDEAKAAAYVEKLGWKLDQNVKEKETVNIPENFDDVYLNYNELQKKAGFDLSPYKGKTVTRYTFGISNYDNIPQVRANILMHDGKVIGGDIMTVAINGFMEPLHARME